MAGSASLLWVLAGFAGLATVAPRLDEAIEPKSASEAASGFSIERAPDGQFYAEGAVGSVAVRLMVDQGADKVLLAKDDAERLGFEVKPGFTAITLPALSVGPHRLRDVEAVIAPDLPVSLLGRSFLARLSGVEVRRDRLTLR